MQYIKYSNIDISTYGDIYVVSIGNDADGLFSVSESAAILLRKLDEVKTYDELVTEISKKTGLTASMAQNNAGNYQLVLSVSNGSSSLAQNDLSLTYSEDTATAYSSEAKTISYNNITKIY